MSTQKYIIPFNTAQIQSTIYAVFVFIQRKCQVGHFAQHGLCP